MNRWLGAFAAAVVFLAAGCAEEYRIRPVVRSADEAPTRVDDPALPRTGGREGEAYDIPVLSDAVPQPEGTRAETTPAAP